MHKYKLPLQICDSKINISKEGYSWRFEDEKFGEKLLGEKEEFDIR